jgi:1-acyl-sn-glycerol-3-phosphate acyltransferase
VKAVSQQDAAEGGTYFGALRRDRTTRGRAEGQLLRALLFNVYFFGLTTVLSFVGVPLRMFARHRAYAFAAFWCRLVLAGAARICGIHVVVTGLEHMPGDGPALLACQHQSAFDTLVWMTLLPRTCYVVKQELTQIPLFGPLLPAAGMIPVDRGAGASALRALVQATAAARDAGRQIVIFPEGTRVAPGVRVPLQPGIAAISARLGLPVIPVATDSGLRWGRRAFLKVPGPIHLALGPPIAAGTRRQELLDALEGFWRAAEINGFRAVDKSVGESARELADTFP